jgi:spore coat polysaccharide biosynthesis protein SpsF
MYNLGSSFFNIVGIVQARMGASRLPGKVLLDIEGEPMLVRVVERTKRAKSLTEILVATSLEKADDPIEQLCTAKGYICYRGSQQDVLDRYYQAARAYSADVIVRITADCPVIDPLVIDQTVAAFWGYGKKMITETDGLVEVGSPTEISSPPKWDFAANRLPPPWQRTFPIGLDTEVSTFSALERAWEEATQAHQREHVMPYLYENENLFRILLVNHAPDYGHLRWTVDTAQDLELIREIYSRFEGRDDFSWIEVLELFRQEPDLAEINRGVSHQDYRDVDSR